MNALPCLDFTVLDTSYHGVAHRTASGLIECHASGCPHTIAFQNLTPVPDGVVVQHVAGLHCAYPLVGNCDVIFNQGVRLPVSCLLTLTSSILEEVSCDIVLRPAPPLWHPGLILWQGERGHSRPPSLPELPLPKTQLSTQQGRQKLGLTAGLTWPSGSQAHVCHPPASVLNVI